MSESPEVPQRSGTHQSGTEWLEQLERSERPLASAVGRIVRDLQDVASAAEEEAVEQLLAATARLDGETTQTDILSAFLEEGCRFASRTAFFLTRPGEVHGWASCGFFGRGVSVLQNVRFAVEDESVWAKLAEDTGVLALRGEECTAVCRELGVRAGRRGVLIPFILRGQLGGALYADRFSGEGNLGVASLQLLAHSAAQTIETAPVRGGAGSATLRSAAVSPQHPAPGVEAPGVEAPGVEVPGAAAIAAGAAALGVAAAVGEAEPPAAAAEEPVPEEPLAEETPEIADEALMEAAEEVAEAAEEVAEAAEEVAEASAEAAVEEAEAVDFEMVSEADMEEAAPPEAQELSAEDLEAAEDIPAELEPEPELEDTSEIWVEEEDDEPTVVGAAVPADQEAPGPPPEVGQETVRLDVAALEGRVPAAPPPAEEETTEVPQWDVAPAPELPPDFELEPEAEAELELEGEEPVAERRTIPEASEDATVVTSRDDLVSPPAAGYVPPAPVEEAPSTEVTPPADFTPRVEVKPPPPPVKPEAGTTQVVPPTDIQGPGSAFAGSPGIPDGEEALHEEARRLARLLVSEIKLYNEEIIEEGRRAGNIYERLKDDIDRSRQMYEERIDPRLLEGDTDYFRQELVQRLAGGDDRLLGY